LHCLTTADPPDDMTSEVISSDSKEKKKETLSVSARLNDSITTFTKKLLSPSINRTNYSPVISAILPYPNNTNTSSHMVKRKLVFESVFQKIISNISTSATPPRQSMLG